MSEDDLSADDPSMLTIEELDRAIQLVDHVLRLVDNPHSTSAVPEVGRP